MLQMVEALRDAYVRSAAMEALWKSGKLGEYAAQRVTTLAKQLSRSHCSLELCKTKRALLLK